MMELGRRKFLLVDIRTKEYGHSAYELMMAVDYARSKDVPVYVVNTLRTPNRGIYRLRTPGAVLLRKSPLGDLLAHLAFRLLYRDIAAQTSELKKLKTEIKAKIALDAPAPKPAKMSTAVPGKKYKKKAAKEAERLAALTAAEAERTEAPSQPPAAA